MCLEATLKVCPKNWSMHEVRHEASKEEGASSLPVSPLQGNQSKSNREDICKTDQKAKYEGACW